MAQTPITEDFHNGGFLVSEANGHRSRDNITLTGAAKVKAGTVLGKKTLGAATSATKAGGNTGTGTFVLDVATPILVNARAGIYTLRCITAAANGGTFELKAPTGDSLGEYAITGGAGGTVTVSDQIKGVLTDAGVDFVVGDGFDVTIAAGSGKYLTAVKTAVDGSNVPAAILFNATDASAADQACTAVVRSCEVNASELVWDASIAGADITAGLVSLASVGIIAR